MELQVGQVVRADAGRDCGGWFAVVALAPDGSVYIADGRHRRVEHPKRKNIRHLTATRRILVQAQLTNGVLRDVLRQMQTEDPSGRETICQSRI